MIGGLQMANQHVPANISQIDVLLSCGVSHLANNAYYLLSQDGLDGLHCCTVTLRFAL